MADFYHHFGKKAYWDEHYYQIKSLSENTFDWFQTYEGVKDIFTQYFDQNAKILNIGCGRSKLAESLYNEGYPFIISIDFSKESIEGKLS